jgi:hypothetical protein
METPVEREIKQAVTDSIGFRSRDNGYIMRTLEQISGSKFDTLRSFLAVETFETLIDDRETVDADILLRRTGLEAALTSKPSAEDRISLTGQKRYALCFQDCL